MKYKTGEVVGHRAMIGPMVVLAKITVETSTSTDVEIMYRCRTYDGRIQDFFDYELKPNAKEAG